MWKLMGRWLGVMTIALVGLGLGHWVAPAAASEERRWDVVDGIHYSVEGEGPTVVLIHSAFMHSGMWAPTMEAIRGRHRIVTIDLRGHGRTPLASSPPFGFDDVAAVMDHLRVARATLIGSSMGGTIAVDYALAHPDRVEGLVLVGSAPAGGVDAREQDVAALESIFTTSRARGHAAGVERWLAIPMNSALSAQAREFIRSASMESPAMFGLSGFDEWPVRFAMPRSMDRVSEIRVPTLIVVGERDNVSTTANARMAAERIAGARLVTFRGTGHFPSIERPARFNALLSRFLRSVRDVSGRSGRVGACIVSACPRGASRLPG